MKLPPWSYSMLRDADICLRQTHHKYVLKDLPFEQSKAAAWGTRVHSAMEARLKQGTPLVDGMQSYEVFVPPKSGQLRGLVEWWCGMREDGTWCDSRAPDVWGRGKVDFALVNHEDHTACVVDWKTGKVREDPDELEIFACFLKAKYPALEKISGWYVWLKEGRMGKIFDLTDTAGKLESIRARVERLGQAAAMDAWAPKQGPLCAWCGVKTCEFHP